MRARTRPLLFVLAFAGLLLAPSLPRAQAISYASGLKVGDSAIYAKASGSWNLTGPPQPPFSQFINLNYTTLQVSRVSGSNISAAQTFVYSNKTARSDTLAGNVGTDSGNITFWFIGANLTTGEPIYSTPNSPVVNQTFTQEFAGAQRTIDALNLTQRPAPGLTAVVNAWWDQQTGILLLVSFRIFEPSGSASLFAELVQTNIWSPGPGVGIASVPTSVTVQQGNSTSLNLLLTSERGFNGSVTIISDLLFCSLGECPIITVNPSTVSLSSGGFTDVTATISTSNSTVPGLYSVIFGAAFGKLLENTTSVSIDVIGGPVRTTVLSNDPSSPDWTVDSPTWTLQNGFLDGSGVVCCLSPKIISSTTFSSDRTVELDVRTPVPGAAEPYYTAWILGKYLDFYDKLLFNISVGGGVGFSMADSAVNSTVHFYSNFTTTFNVTQWHHVKLVFSGDNARAYVNGTLCLNVTDPIVAGLGNGPISLASWGDSESQFNKVTVTASVLPDEPPTASFTYYPQPAKSGQLVNFNGVGSFDPDGYIATWTWDFGDATSGVGEFTSHTYTNPGNYTVTLRVTDNSGQTATFSQTIMVVQPIVHDVGIVNLFVSPVVALSGQTVGLEAQLVNLGLQQETVNVTFYANSRIAATITGVNVPVNVFPVYVSASWGTTGVTPGNYTMSATVILPTDQNPSNNHFTDGQVTILPPPAIVVLPSSGPIGTRVMVHGSGFSNALFPSPFAITVDVSFDDQFVGFIPSVSNGTFNFFFDVPLAQQGLHQIHAYAQFYPQPVEATANFTVTPTPAPSSLSLSISVGSIYFPRDTATIYVLSSLNGNPTPVQTLQLTLLLPGGTTRILTLTSLGAGIYRATYPVPSTGSIGTYALTATAKASGANATALGSFEVKPTWLQGNGRTIATATGIVGAIGAVSLVGYAWRKGYFARRKDEFPIP